MNDLCASERRGGKQQRECVPQREVDRELRVRVVVEEAVVVVVDLDGEHVAPGHEVRGVGAECERARLAAEGEGALDRRLLVPVVEHALHSRHAPHTPHTQPSAPLDPCWRDQPPSR